FVLIQMAIAIKEQVGALRSLALLYYWVVHEHKAIYLRGEIRIETTVSFYDISVQYDESKP
ncbi:MAG: hypothetical protein RLZZ139_3473, partial [Cyanobacteriota bacterium]